MNSTSPNAPGLWLPAGHRQSGTLHPLRSCHQENRTRDRPQGADNRHSGNTGIRNLPPSQPPLIWYAGLQKEFPELGNGGESAIAGPIYRHRQTYPAKLALPARYESCWFIGEYARGWVKAAKLDAQGKLQSIHPVLPPLRLGKPTNLKLGPQGRLHVLYYTKDDQGALVRIENKGAVKSAIAQALVHGLEQPPRFVKKSRSPSVASSL